MKIVLLLTFVVAIALAKMPQQFIDKYSVEYLNEGSSHSYPPLGSKVEVHYTGTLLNGKKFDSSRDRGTPFTFTVGQQQVITCWDEVVAHLAVGDKVNVVCPSATAYGSRGVGPIPANSDLRFEIEMLGFN